MRGMPEKDVSTCLQLAEELGVVLPIVQQCFDAGKSEVKRTSDLASADTLPWPTNIHLISGKGLI